MVGMLMRGHALMFTTIVVFRARITAERAAPIAMNATARILENRILTIGGWKGG
jgi:hypothetical protein